MDNTKLDRVLEIFFRGLRGEDLSIQKWLMSMLFPPKASVAVLMI